MPSSPPTDVSVQATSPTSIQMSWNPPKAANGIIKQYSIKIYEKETKTNILFSSTQATILVQSLHPFFQYECVVSALTISQGPWSEPILLRLPEAGK